MLDAILGTILGTIWAATFPTALTYHIHIPFASNLRSLHTTDLLHTLDALHDLRSPYLILHIPILFSTIPIAMHTNLVLKNHETTYAADWIRSDIMFKT